MLKYPTPAWNTKLHQAHKTLSEEVQSQLLSPKNDLHTPLYENSPC